MTAQLPSNPWDSLQRPGVAASDAPSSSRPLAFVAGDDVGFDMRLELPAVCLKCGTSEDVSHDDEKLRLKIDRMALALAAAAGEKFRATAALVPGEYRLRLPLCGRCAARADRARELTFAFAISPLWVMGGAVLLTLVGGWIVSLGAAILMLSLPVLGIAAYVARSSAVLTVAIDGDGFVKLEGVHPDASLAIAKAAGLQ